MIESVDTYGIGSQKLYGAATFGFLTNLISIPLIALTGVRQGSLYILGSVITNHQYWVGNGIYLNAMCTVYYPFIVDWGYIGPFIGPFILAAITFLITKRAYQKITVETASLYIYILYVLFRTVFKWELLNIDLSVIYITMRLFTYRRPILGATNE